MKVGSNHFQNFEDIIYRGKVDTPGEVSLEAIFAGNGTIEDYAYLNIKDKAVIVLMDTLTLVKWRALVKSSATAFDKGAKLVLAVPNVPSEKFKQFGQEIKTLFAAGGLILNKLKPNNSDRESFLISPIVASQIFNSPFEEIVMAAKEKSTKKPLLKIPIGRISYSITMDTKMVKTENVLGYLEGTDKRDELIIISAHLDHIGLSSGEDKVNNGADDDGSGTVSVLQLAKAFTQAKKDGNGPRRSILFMTVTGEEPGLLGSQYYVEHPVFPLANTVVDLNIDMVGRRDPTHSNKPDYVYLIGSDKLSSELHEINERNNQLYTNLDFDYTYNDENHPARLYYRSDHWNFAKNNIPIIFYFDGLHEDYHKPSDEVSKIDFDLLAKRAKIVFHTAWDLANRDNRVIVDKK